MIFIETKCKKCGAELDVDLDNLIAFCPYCGSKLRIDMKNMDKVIAAKEKTKRTKIQYERESQKDYYDYEINSKQEERKNSFSKTLKFLLIWIILMAVCLFIIKFM